MRVKSISYFIHRTKHFFSFTWLFPDSEHGARIRTYTAKTLKDFYAPALYHGVVCLADYHTPLIKSCVAATKFEHNMRAAQLLSTLLVTHLTTTIARRTLLIPIPLHYKRERERYYNQVSVVLEMAQKQYQTVQLNTTLLQRPHATKRQTSLGKSERNTNMKRAFVYTNSAFNWQQYDTVILCDDVMTTGATLREARATLAPHLPPHVTITCLAFAH